MQETSQIPVAPTGQARAGVSRVAVKWTSTSFKCGIRRRVEPVTTLHRALDVIEPVLLRVIGTGGNTCPVAIFFTASGICAASAGW